MEHAFTDDMVRRDREVLTGAALEYLRNYTGDFHVLVRAKHLIGEGYGLNIAQIRTVLNTMRADTSVRLDYEPPASTNVISFPSRNRRAVFSDDEFDPEYEEPPLKREPTWFRVPFRLKLPYGMSMALRAEVIHLMSNERSKLEYFPIGSWYQGKKVFTQPRWEFNLYYECSQAAKKLRMLTDQEAEVLVDLGYMRFCRTCQSFREARES